MAACPEYEPLLIEKCGGFLSPENAARLSRHLERCPQCRSEEALFGETLSLAEVEDEAARLDSSIAGATLGIWNRQDRRRTRVRAFAAGMILAAGCAGALWIRHSDVEHRAESAPVGLTAELQALDADPELEPFEEWVEPEALEPVDADALEALIDPDELLTPDNKG